MVGKTVICSSFAWHIWCHQGSSGIVPIGKVLSHPGSSDNTLVEGRSRPLSYQTGMEPRLFRVSLHLYRWLLVVKMNILTPAQLYLAAQCRDRGLLMTNWEKNRLESKLPVWPLLSYTWWCLAGVNDYYPVLLSVYLDNSFLGLLGRKSRLLSYFLSLIDTKAPHWSAYAHPEGNQ